MTVYPQMGVSGSCNPFVKFWSPHHVFGWVKTIGNSNLACGLILMSTG